MTLTFTRIAPDAEWSLWQAQQAIDEAWDAWRKASCVERNGGHDWHAELPCIEDDAYVRLFCLNCPAGVDDLMHPDGTDLVFGEVDGIPVENGKARSLDYYTAPVVAKVHVEHYPSNPAHGEEWDVWIEVSSRAA